MKIMGLKNALIGFVIGDILGVPVEFVDRELLLVNPVVGLRDYGTHNQPLGSFSDDTSMTLCTIESLINQYTLEEVMILFSKWCYNNYMTSHGVTF